MPHDQTPSVVDPLPAPPPGPPWDRIAGLLDALAASGRADPIESVLRTVRDTLPACAAVHDPGPAGGAVQIVGPDHLTPAWGRDLVNRLTSSTDREVLHAELPTQRGDGPSPRSVVLVCLSRTRRAWLAAVRLAPGPRFAPDHLRQLAFVRQLYANHLTQEQAKTDLKGALYGLVHCLSSAIDAKDPYTAGHSERVARMAVRLAEQMRLPAAVRSELYLTGLLHDVGKIGVSDAVLRKAGPLTDAEFAEVKKHPEVGERIVSQVRQLRHHCPGIRWHHERMDGRGYPDGLAGDAIPLPARVLAVADSVDAMTSSRPYRDAMPTAKVEGILSAGNGVQWDPAVVDAFHECKLDLYAICNRGLGESVAAALNSQPTESITVPAPRRPAGLIPPTA